MAAANDFHRLTISAMHKEPGDALVVTFAVPPALGDVFRFKPGQHIALRATIDGAEARRNYSICAGPGEPLSVAIKRMESGVFSTFAHATFAVGMSIDVMPPTGRFVLTPYADKRRHILAFAAGSGITPIIGIMQQALAEAQDTRVTLVYANRTRDTVMFGEALEALKDHHLGRFELVSIYSRPGEVDSPLLEGRITGDKVKALGETLLRYNEAERIFLCGPGSFIKDVRKTLMDIGVPVANIAHEFFAAGGGQPRPPKASAPTIGTAERAITVVLDGSRHRVPIAKGETVLAAALRAGLKAPYACAGGMCSTCRAQIVEGAATMQLNYSLEPWEIAKGFTLTCQAVPTTEMLTIDWDAM